MAAVQQEPVNIFNVSPYKELISIDAYLFTEDGVVFKVQRMLLAEKSPYFRALFCGNFSDGTEILLHGIDGKTLEYILKYLHTNSISLDHENVIDILIASDYLLVDPLQEMCKSYIFRELTADNCLSVLCIAWRIESILAYCYRFVIIHFEEAIRTTSIEIMGDLPLEAVAKILKEKSLNIRDEKTVWGVIENWVKYNSSERLRFVSELLRCISLTEIDEALAIEIMNNSIVQNNPFCDGFTVKKIPSLDRNKNGSILHCHIRQNQSYLDGPRIPPRVHFVVHNRWPAIGCSELYMTYDNELDFWRKLTRIPFCPNFIVQIGKCVYMFDSMDNSKLGINMLNHNLTNLPPSNIHRLGYSVVALRDYIYILGGATKNFGETNAVERYNPKTNIWDIITPIQPMITPKVIVFNESIYVIGGIDRESVPAMVVQVYNPVLDYWKVVNAPSTFRHDFIAVGFRDGLYVIGGQDFDSLLLSVEVYELCEDTWRSLPDLPFAYDLPQAVVLNDELIVYENHEKKRDTSPPVYWDTSIQNWQIICKSSPLYNVHLYHFCTIHDAEIVRDFVMQNRALGSKWDKSSLP